MLESEQRVFNSLSGEFDEINKWKMRSFVAYWKFLFQRTQYGEEIEAMRKKPKQGQEIPEPESDYWKQFLKSST